MKVFFNNIIKTLPIVFNPIPGGGGKRGLFGPRLGKPCNNICTTAAINLKFSVPS